MKTPTFIGNGYRYIWPHTGLLILTGLRANHNLPEDFTKMMANVYNSSGTCSIFENIYSGRELCTNNFRYSTFCDFFSDVRKQYDDLNQGGII